ncbi:RNA methyltransferase [Anaerosinus gibii]|uniref:RNA methyltransferase n=1 Tax=Selenobaculum gibii TaxID=3054208 RepID=A0A9Y2AH28_9FIRM|nr:RNA methyltransferase [Selenobaculum gbiensis]WIW69583.1 RNA methyltransferase [Selenobaculum gbiensis]
MARVYIGLVHYPIYNKHNQIVTTAITNFDIHDIARTARTYGIDKYFLIHPLDTQAELANNVIQYWQDGYGGQHHPDRKEAFRTLSLVKTIDEAISNIKEETGNEPYIITTDARIYPNTISYSHLRKKIENDNNSYLILFGTGWGIENKVMAQFNYILEPIYGPVDYNHLPVRAAVAIILDRLLGELWWEK